ncbi:MAG: hypothetical protein WCC92_00670 [Candidatus Korobacteraceae bacterium]
MPAKANGKLLSVVQISLGLLLAAGFYRFGMARNQGRIPNWLDIAFSVAWGALVVLVIIVQARRAEERYVGDLQNKPITLNPDEKILFKSRFMSGKFVPAGMVFNSKPSFREWLRGGPVTVIRLLAVQVTNKRLIFGMFLGRTWRVIELSMVKDVALVKGKWPYRNALLVEFDTENRIEKILFSICSGRGRRLKAALEAALALQL